jgi:hypothetical protein
MELGNLLLRFAQGHGAGEGFGNRFTGYSPGEAQLRIVSGVVGLGTMTARLTTPADDRSDGARPKVTQAQELLQELGTLGFQSNERIGHEGGPPF